MASLLCWEEIWGGGRGVLYVGRWIVGYGSVFGLGRSTLGEASHRAKSSLSSWSMNNGVSFVYMFIYYTVLTEKSVM